MSEAHDRAVGSVLGLALGDALGAPFEFHRARQIPSPLPAFERSWMGWPPGTWTDDTAMARNPWLSLIAGALHGREALPPAWLAVLAERSALEAEAELFADGCIRLDPPEGSNG